MSADAVGGSPLIGVNGLSIIAHGSATGVAILNAIRMACELHDNNVNKQIVETMGKINEALKEIEAE
jgi:glycerol-3-phosphate acyltransferase PlsX